MLCYENKSVCQQMATPDFRPLFFEWSTRRASGLLPCSCTFGGSLLGSGSHPVLFGAVAQHYLGDKFIYDVIVVNIKMSQQIYGRFYTCWCLNKHEGKDRLRVWPKSSPQDDAKSHKLFLFAGFRFHFFYYYYFLTGYLRGMWANITCTVA